MYLLRTLMMRPQQVSFGGAAGAASGNAWKATALVLGRYDFGLQERAHEALRLPFWAVLETFLVF
jgi:hypothetical protein